MSNTNKLIKALWVPSFKRQCSYVGMTFELLLFEIMASLLIIAGLKFNWNIYGVYVFTVYYQWISMLGLGAVIAGLFLIYIPALLTIKKRTYHFSETIEFQKETKFYWHKGLKVRTQIAIHITNKKGLKELLAMSEVAAARKMAKDFLRSIDFLKSAIQNDEWFQGVENVVGTSNLAKPGTLQRVGVATTEFKSNSSKVISYLAVCLAARRILNPKKYLFKKQYSFDITVKDLDKINTTILQRKKATA